jgi:hypothetical protein
MTMITSRDGHSPLEIDGLVMYRKFYTCMYRGVKTDQR